MAGSNGWKLEPIETKILKPCLRVLARANFRIYEHIHESQCFHERCGEASNCQKQSMYG